MEGCVSAAKVVHYALGTSTELSTRVMTAERNGDVCVWMLIR